MIAMALTTQFIGVHTVLGAFVAGVLIGESPILTRYIDAQLRGLILAFFMPVFLGVAGLSTDLTTLMRPDLLFLSMGLIAVASLGKFAGAFFGAKIGGLTKREATGSRLWYERQRLNRDHRGHDRPFLGGDQSNSLHHDRHHGGDHDHGDAANIALGFVAGAVACE